MRKHFSRLLFKEMRRNKRIYLLTADMGYGLWDDVRREFPDQFINVGSSEQLMLGMAAGLAMEKKIPVCYSITPFLLYRPFEFIRNFMQFEQLPIKLAGGGRDRDYGYLGYTHWAEEDVDILRPLSNIEKYKPLNVEDLDDCFASYLYGWRPAYVNLQK